MKLFTKEEEQQICNEYLFGEKLNTYILAKRWGCNHTTIREIIKRNGYKLRTKSEAKKGQKAWNKYIPQSEEHRRKNRESHIGQKAWNKNLTKETDERVAKNYPPRSEETKQKIREKILFRIQTQHGPFKNTKPELKMKEILTSLGIPFEHQFRLGNHNFDFYILNTNILIEVDGDYFHGNLEKFPKLSKIQKQWRQKDIKINELAKDSNYTLLRFWEDDILKNTEEVIELLKGVL